MRRPRWSRWAFLAGAGVVLGAVVVAARPAHKAAQPPLVVQVHRGDTLWTLAKSHSDPGRDVRDTVAELMRANHVLPGELQPGDKLLIPSCCLPRER